MLKRVSVFAALILLPLLALLAAVKLDTSYFASTPMHGYVCMTLLAYYCLVAAAAIGCFFVPGTVQMLLDFKAALGDFKAASLGRKLIGISFFLFAPPLVFIFWRLTVGLQWWGEMMQIRILLGIGASVFTAGLILKIKP